MLIKVQQDKPKAQSLKKMVEISLERINKQNLDYPSHTLADYYDIFKKLIEAIDAVEGIKFIGEGAHFLAIKDLCKRYNLSKSDEVLMQELREYRNRVAYEGFFVNKEYILSNQKRINYLIKNLLKKLNLLIQD